MSDAVYIGRVLRVNDNPERHYRLARVEPLIRSSDDLEVWLGPIEDPLVAFPSRGSVFWYNSPLGLAEGELKQFDIDIQHNYGGEPDKDKYQVRNPKDILEIVDLRHVGSERDIRMLLQKEGIHLKGGILGKRCLLWIEDNKWVGEISLIQVENSNNWIFAPEQDLVALRCREIPSGAIQSVEFDGTRYLLKPKYGNLGKHVGFVNWEPDKELARRVFDRLLKRDRETAEALDVTKKVFRKYMEIVENSGLVGPQLMKELAYSQRVAELVETITKNEELLDETATVCFDVDPVKNKVKERVEIEYQRLLEERKKQLDDDLFEKKADMEEIDKELIERKEVLSSIKERIGALEAKLKKQTDSYETELNRRLAELSNTPERMFAEMAVIKAMMPQKGLAAASPIEIECALPDVPIIENSDEFLGTLYKHLLKFGLSPGIGLSLHSILLAGQVPVLIGPQAYETILAYSNCVSGGILHWIPVGGSVFEPSDILARYDQNSRCVVPHPGGLLDLLLDRSETIKIVVLDGFNRAAVDGYLFPLLQSIQDIDRNRLPRHIPLAPENICSDSDPYRNVRRVAWNRNVLPLLCPSMGSASLPVPKEMWEYCAIIDTWDTMPTVISNEQPIESLITRIHQTFWNDCKKETNQPGELKDIPNNTPVGAGVLPPSVLYNFHRTLRAGVSVKMKVKDALDQAFRLSLQPYLIAAEEDVETWFNHYGINMNSIDQRIGDAVKKLGE